MSAAALAGCARTAEARGFDDAGELAAFADSLMPAALARYHVPGGVISVVREDAVMLERGYGYADLEQRTPVYPTGTIFRVASGSKVFTAAAVMQCVERGELTLDEDVNRYLHRFRVPDAFGGPVTVRQLLTHTAGFDDRNLARKSARAADAESLGGYLARRLPPRILPPGRYLCYSNHGMALAGYLVEEVTGIPFARYVRDSVFTPLSMQRSSFDTPFAPEDLAIGYDDSDPPRPRRAEYVRTVPASMMTTTGNDAWKFMMTYLGDGWFHGQRLLREESLAEMRRTQFTQHARLPGIALGFWERFQNGERALWHDGDGAGFASMMYLLPEHRTGIFLAFNGRGGGQAREEVLAALLDRYFPDERAIETPEPMDGAAAEIARCAGTYVFNRYGHRSLERLVSLESQIEARAEGGMLSFRNRRWVPVEPRVFERSDGRGRLVFDADAGGRIVAAYTGDPIARVYERMPWYETAGAQLTLLLFCALVFLATLIAWPVAAFLRRTRGSKPGPALERRFDLAANALSAIALVFLVGLGVFLTTHAAELELGIPAAFVALLALPILCVLLALALVYFGVRIGKDPGVPTGARIRVFAVTLAGLLFAIWLAEWNLIGWRF